jgi:hypothetical protein
MAYHPRAGKATCASAWARDRMHALFSALASLRSADRLRSFRVLNAVIVSPYEPAGTGNCDPAAGGIARKQPESLFPHAGTTCRQRRRITEKER